MSDLATMAENRLDSLLAADEGNDPTPPAGGDGGGQQPPAGGDDTPPANDDPNNNPDGDGKDPDNNQDGQDDDPAKGNQPPKGDEEDPAKGSQPTDDAGKPKGDEAPKELSDDELMAELEKRGLKVAKKDEPEKQERKAPEIVRPEELSESTWSGMKPVQRYIYNELPYITVDLVDAEGNKSQVSIKTPDQIPEGLVYADARAQARAQNAFDEQNDRANNMYRGIQQNSQQAREQQQQQQENQAIIKGVEQLQADGIVPKITAQPGTPEFDKDPGVIRANQILEYRQKLINAGETVSVVSAGKMFKADNPDLYVTKPVESPADKERREKSKNISGGGRGTPSQADKSEKTNARTKYPVGMSATDIADIAGADLD